VDVADSVAQRADSTRRDTVVMTMTTAASPIFETGSAPTATVVLFVDTESGDETPLSIESAPPLPTSPPVGFSGIFFR